MKPNQSQPQPSLTYDFYNTPWGRGLTAASVSSVVRVYLPSEPEEKLLERMRKDLDGSSLTEGGPISRKMADELERYFRGEKIRFSCPLDLESLTPFQRRVATAASEIPYGSVDTYGGLARKAGSPRAFRAAGQVMARNNLPIVIPCHRVLGQGGLLGGFSSGLEWKVRLLEMERGSASP